MKRLLVLILFIPVLVQAQENSMFYPLVKDASYKLVTTNKKGKQRLQKFTKFYPLNQQAMAQKQLLSVLPLM
jgi:hypothetical protein